MEDEYNVDLTLMESHLSRFVGGEVTLSKEYWEEGIAIIYLNHPEKRNAISGKMILDFDKCIRHLESWDKGKCVLLCGMGKNFCSGGDLNFAKATGTPKEGFYMSYSMQDILKRLKKLPLVSFSLVHGTTLGGGAEIAVFPDYVLVTDDAKIGFVHGKMGIITAFGGTTRLIEMVGKRKALEMLLSSKIYNADECLSLGLASKKISTANKIEEALNYIRQFTVHHCSITRTFKQVVSQEITDFEDRLVFERRLFYPMWGSDLNKIALDKQLNLLKK